MHGWCLLHTLPLVPFLLIVILMSCTCCDPPAPPGVSKADVIGRLELTGSGCCNASPPYTFRYGECCLPTGPSSSAEWQKALPEIKPLLAEPNNEVEEKCCGKADVYKIKTKLDAGWTPRLNAALAKYGLTAQTSAFLRYNSHGQYGGHMEPVLHLLVYSTNDPNIGAEMERIKKESEETFSMSAPKTQAMSS